ncbi:MAG: hypothetical protein HS108_10695 [Planctomycetes bacterium]|jgi:hypothetical protein|nr:hypothetical protein [Planctomycetota bacterium]MCL4731663.1 hypothetical protein [Planctomycetota bacterium]
MKTTCALLLLLTLGLAAHAQEKAGDKITLKLRSGEEFEGTAKKVTEDGVRLDLGDGLELFVRWAFIRGDKHLALRKQAADYTSVASLTRLADFCHENALDDEQAYVLASALKLEPGNRALRERLAKLPKPAGLEVPDEPGKSPEPVPEPEPRPDQPKDPTPLPPPTRPTFKVYIEMVNEDAAAVTWLTEEFEKMRYTVGTKNDHEMHLKVTLDLTLKANPKFMGAELYAIYDGTLKYELFRKGEKKNFSASSYEAKGVRRDTKAEAISACRKEVLTSAFPDIHRALEKQR